jgi:hypothetical protein
MKLLGFDRSTTDQNFEFVRYWEREWEYSEKVLQVFIHFREAYD